MDLLHAAVSYNTTVGNYSDVSSSESSPISGKYVNISYTGKHSSRVYGSFNNSYICTEKLFICYLDLPLIGLLYLYLVMVIVRVSYGYYTGIPAGRVG